MEQEQLLVPNDEYLKSGIHIGTKFKTKYMSNFIYKTRPDGLSVLNVQQIDARIKVLIKFLAQYEPQNIMIAARRENGWKPVRIFAEMTGAKVYTGRYPPGILTNIQLKKFTETKLLLVTDPWPDRNAVEDAFMMGIPIIGLCDTNNQANLLDFVMPCNNKGKKSLGLLFYLLTKGYLEARGMINQGGFTKKIEDFSDEV
ncbi:30S ribosomal protein S2 [Candidatus Woesearchaeota archaeon]|nr:30S ribosomal protein S2 [Candidatus Woesearchaeota archaeon]